MLKKQTKKPTPNLLNVLVESVLVLGVSQFDRDTISLQQSCADKVWAHEHCVEMPYGKLCKPLANICINYTCIVLFACKAQNGNEWNLSASVGGNKSPSPLTDGKIGPTCTACSFISEEKGSLKFCCAKPIVNKGRLGKECSLNWAPSAPFCTGVSSHSW